MDWIGNGDHDNGGGREYSWWLIQKFTDAYHVQGPLHADVHLRAQRRLSARPPQLRVRQARRPHPAAPGRARRGRSASAASTPTTPRCSTATCSELDGICAVHTSATSMGTDWRDNDPVVEPIVEIYQGDRMSYEIRGGAAGRLRCQDAASCRPTSPAGSQAGFVNNAFEKGYRLGFQASSDHWSTHISYCIVLAERHDRQGDPRRLARNATATAPPTTSSSTSAAARTSWATSSRPATAPTLQITVHRHEAAWRRIEVLKDSEVVAHLQAGQATNTTAPGPTRSPTRGGALLLRPRPAGRRRAGLGLAAVDRLREVMNEAFSGDTWAGIVGILGPLVPGVTTGPNRLKKPAVAATGFEFEQTARIWLNRCGCLPQRSIEVVAGRHSR